VTAEKIPSRVAASYEDIDTLVLWDKNPRTNQPIERVAASIERFGFGSAVLARRSNRQVVAGHTRIKALRHLQTVIGYWDEPRRAALAARLECPTADVEQLRAWLGVAPVRFLELSADEAAALALADNKLNELAEWDDEGVAAVLAQLAEVQIPLELLGWEPEPVDIEDPTEQPPARPSLSDRFIVPPFSVLDARQGYWQDRKRAWLAIGMESALGRGAAPGGSEMPAASTQDGRTVRGAGDGRPLADKTGNLTFVTGSGADETSQKILASGPKTRPLTFVHGNYDDFVSQRILAQGPQSGSGTSIFDPVLCELSYRWFCTPGGSVLDPFAGGSVRGIVAGLLGLAYTGIELRREQIDANEVQAERLLKQTGPLPEPVGVGGEGLPPAAVSDPAALTPVELHNGIWLKRDDLFQVGEANGGKVRGILAMIKPGCPGIIACGSRQSTQIARAAQVARHLGIPCRIHTGAGSDTVEIREARDAGAEIIQHAPARLTVIKARARADAASSGWTEIPWGLECSEGIDATAPQVDNIPAEVKRLVVVVGGGMSLSAILDGLDAARRELPILGITVGGDPSDRLDQWAPGWRERGVTLVPSGLDYEAEVTASIDGVVLDPVYEAKAARFLEPGDCLWIVGCRSSARRAAVPAGPAPGSARWVHGNSERLAELVPGEQFDLVFSCPPYGDLEVYSDDPEDLSTMDHPTFLAAYRRIIAASVAQLRPNRFACFVVGDFRDKKGFYRNFVADTIEAFQAAGATLYNEAVLATAVSSLPLRAGRQFAVSRKLGKALADETPVLTPDGWTPIGELEVGDRVIAGDGTATRVLGVHPQGQRDLLRVTFDDDSFVDADSEHLWRIEVRNEEPSVMTTAEILTRWGPEPMDPRPRIPFCDPVQFTERPVPSLDPYLVGLLLGDGGLTGNTPILTVADAEIAELLPELLPDGMVIKSRGYDHRLVGAGARRSSNPLTVELRKLGLMGRYSYEKSVPTDYLWGSVEVRLAVLRGLMDTDGTTNRASTEFYSSSEQLAADVAFLARSLGMRAKVSTKTTTHRLCYRVRLYGGPCPFRLGRKADAWHQHNDARMRRMTRKIVSVRPVEPRSATCITVAHPSALYVVKDFIVTHNTHQNVLVFYKGDPTQIRDTFGEVVVTMPDLPEAEE
jgi:hypothetical protein